MSYASYIRELCLDTPSGRSSKTHIFDVIKVAWNKTGRRENHVCVTLYEDLQHFSLLQEA
jgi:hypothetical protein